MNARTYGGWQSYDYCPPARTMWLRNAYRSVRAWGVGVGILTALASVYATVYANGYVDGYLTGKKDAVQEVGQPTWRGTCDMNYYAYPCFKTQDGTLFILKK